MYLVPARLGIAPRVYACADVSQVALVVRIHHPRALKQSLRSCCVLLSARPSSPKNATADQPSVVFDRPSTVHSTRTQNSSAAVRRERQHTPRHNSPKEHKTMEGPLACPTCRKRPHEIACGNKVFAKAHCPCCLETHEPVVALPCGHAVCEDCFGRLGARLVDEAADPAPALPPHRAPRRRQCRPSRGSSAGARSRGSSRCRPR